MSRNTTPAYKRIRRRFINDLRAIFRSNQNARRVPRVMNQQLRIVVGKKFYDMARQKRFGGERKTQNGRGSFISYENVTTILHTHTRG